MQFVVDLEEWAVLSVALRMYANASPPADKLDAIARLQEKLRNLEVRVWNENQRKHTERQRKKAVVELTTANSLSLSTDASTNESSET